MQCQKEEEEEEDAKRKVGRPRGDEEGGTKWVFRGNCGEFTVHLYLSQVQMPVEPSGHITERLGRHKKIGSSR